MSEQSFSRPGAVDLSGLQGSCPVRAVPPDRRPARRTPSRSTEQNFQEILEASRNAPVLLAFESPSRSPESVQLADDLQTLSTEFEGRFLLGRVDIDAVAADRPGDADPVGPAGGAGGPGSPDAAAPGRSPRSRSCARR